jgi:prolyl-tRNA synthetase
MAAITPRAQDYSQWYIDLILNAKLADYGPVKGTMVIRPSGYAIWENIQVQLDAMFKETGHVNAYFPMFIPESFLKKEAEHVEGFAPELAIVTHAGGKELEENLVVRPTSETIIWHMYKKWIKSHRDLPLLYNQWANVVRWEMRTRLFLRTTEFLWQEGHTAHATAAEAIDETEKMLYVYKRFAEDVLAIPVIHGTKTAKERFAGAVDTKCIEAMMQDGKALQAGTSHFLGQNFAKAFDVKYQDDKGEWEFVWATSWGVSTRLIGALIMAHSDDKGLILPPKVAQYQAVIVPITRKDTDINAMNNYCEAIRLALHKAGVRVYFDNRDHYSPGWKFSEWELLGIPLRLEIGPRDLENNQLVMARRDKEKGEEGQKTIVAQNDLVKTVLEMLGIIQQAMYDKALKFQLDNSYSPNSYDEFNTIIESKSGFHYVHWCGSAECEETLKEKNKATIRCLPINEIKENGNCIVCNKTSTNRVLVAKSY